MYHFEHIMKTLRDNANFLNRYGVEKIGLFGSFIRNEHTSDSDLDFLVKFKKEAETFDNYMELKFYLAELFKRDVDLVTEEAIRPEMKDSIMENVKYV